MGSGENCRKFRGVYLGSINRDASDIESSDSQFISTRSRHMHY